MKKIFTLITLLLGLQLSSNATHVRGGEFSYSYLGGNTFKVQIRTYTEAGIAGQDRLPFCWGDGLCDTIFRVSIDTMVVGNYIILKNVYEGKHTYAGYGRYRLSVNDSNRVDFIANINFGASDQISLFVEDTLNFFDPTIYGPANSSPILPSYAVDFGRVGEVFHHYVGAYDPDGDSLSFEIDTPLQWPGIAVPNWQWPDSVKPPFSTFTIDHATGDITWNTPNDVGWYNVGIRIVEYRKRDNGNPKYVEIGSEMRDLQIIIDPPLPSPAPALILPFNTCIIAGTNINFTIIATENDSAKISLTASGGPFDVVDSASFVQSLLKPGIANGIFQWQTSCDNSRRDYYNVIIRARNNHTNPVLTTGLWKVKVVAPPPQGLTATAVGDSIVLNWQSNYACDTVSSKQFVGFSLWRHEGSNSFTIDTCVTGLAGQGYTEIAEQLKAYNYADYSTVAGKQYCYRLLAEFGYLTSLGYICNGVQSLTSNEACVASQDTNLSVQNITGAKIRLTLSPNPVADVLTVNLAGVSTTAELEMYDLPGKKLFSSNEKPQGYSIQRSIDLSQFTDGIYILTIKVNGRKYERKVVKQ